MSHRYVGKALPDFLPLLTLTVAARKLAGNKLFDLRAARIRSQLWFAIRARALASVRRYVSRTS